MIKKNIDLSIIIPVYNVEKYLPHCLDSIFNQSLDNSDFEVIVVNDCSKGNCEEIIKEAIDLNEAIKNGYEVCKICKPYGI